MEESYWLGWEGCFFQRAPKKIPPPPRGGMILPKSNPYLIRLAWVGRLFIRAQTDKLTSLTKVGCFLTFFRC